MRSFVAAALIAILAVSSSAADAVASKKSKRTLKEEIDLALKEGKDDTIAAPMAEKFGFGSVEQTTKKLRYKQSISPDKREHSFVVIVTQGKNGPKPKAIELSCGTGQRVDGKLVVDTVYYTASLSGKIEKAFHNAGPVGNITSEELSVKSEDVKKRFREEMEFHLQRVAELALETAR